MLGRLLKYEIKATARLFLPLYLTVLVFSVINRLFLAISNNGQGFPFYEFIKAISMFTYVTLMIGLVVMTLFVMIQRFYKNLLGDEGYLMFTLPVKSWGHILSKLIIAMLWTIASGIVAFCSILVVSSKNIDIAELYSRFINVLVHNIQEFGVAAPLVGLEVIIAGLLSLASTILVIYSAIALGHLFNKYKLLASFGMYIALQIVSQTVMSLFAFVFFSMDIFRPDTTFIPSIVMVNGMLLFSILFTGTFAAAYFYLTNFILKRKLNLE